MGQHSYNFILNLEFRLHANLTKAYLLLHVKHNSITAYITSFK